MVEVFCQHGLDRVPLCGWLAETDKGNKIFLWFRWKEKWHSHVTQLSAGDAQHISSILEAARFKDIQQEEGPCLTEDGSLIISADAGGKRILHQIQGIRYTISRIAGRGGLFKRYCADQGSEIIDKVIFQFLESTDFSNSKICVVDTRMPWCLLARGKLFLYN